MKKIKTTIAYFAILIFITAFSVNAESFDSDAISQVSQGIAEWKLLNENKGETQIEKTVYVSSSLSKFVEIGSDQQVAAVAGLSALDMKYVPWESRDIARNMDQKYQRYGGIFVVTDRTIKAPGDFVPPIRTNSGMWGPAVVKINPDMIGKYVYYQGRLEKFTYGQVLAHELEHAKDWGSPRYAHPRLGEINPMKGDIFYTSQINTKISTNPVRMSMAKLENYSLKDPFYNITQRWHLSQVPDVNTLRLPDSYFNRATTYPPPNILFSTRDPLTTYTSPMPKTPAYSPYSTPKVPTYTPSRIPSYSGRRY